MIHRAQPFAWLRKIPWRAVSMWTGAAAFGTGAGVACAPYGVSGSVLGILVSAAAGAFGGAALFDALSPLMPPSLAGPVSVRNAATVPDARLAPSSAWHFDYQQAEPDDAWICDEGRSQVAWAEATLAARDAWERAARNSRTRVVLGKRVIVGDPPPRSGDDT